MLRALRPAEKSESEQIDFFARSYERFLRAKESAGTDSHFYRVADTVVRVTFAGDALVPYITPALEHLRVPAADPDLTLCVWDSRSTAVEMVPPPCTRQDFTDEGDVLGFNSSRIKFAFHRSDYSVNLLDQQTRTGIYWVPDAGAVPYWGQAVPLRTLLHWWMQHNGCQILHAAAVGMDDGAVLLTGKSGKGKSTAALSCLQTGLYYLGDDSVVVRLEPEPFVYSLYCAAKLHAEDMAHFSSLAGLARNPEQAGREKWVMLLYPRFERQVVSAMPLKAIVLPHIADLSETRIIPAAAREVLRAFTPMSDLQLPHVGRRTQDFIRCLCSTLPGYTLHMGRSRATTPTAISDLLTRPHDAPRADHARPRNDPDRNPIPLLSVIVAVFNGQRQIKNAVERALAQDYPALEVVVVDDGSTDWTPEIISRLPYEIRYFRTRHAGPASARNRGVKEASGEFLAFLDLQDLWPDNTLRRLVDELVRDHKTDTVHGSVQVVWRNPENDEYEALGHPKGPTEFRPTAAVFRRSAFAKVGLFDTTLMVGEEADWLARAKESNVQIKHIEEVTLLIRRDTLDVTGEGKGGDFGALRLLKETRDRKRAQAFRAWGGQ